MVSWAGAEAADSRLVLALGDSLTAGYGLMPEAAFPRRLEQRLRDQGFELTIVNAGVSGDTTTAARNRLDWVLASLADKPELVIMELGANDAMRGIPTAVTRANMEFMLRSLHNLEIPVLLTGMLAPPNFGREYSDAFNAIFPDLVRQFDVAFYPFFLDGVAGDPALNQNDGIHPDAAGVEIIVSRIIPFVIRALK